MDYNKYLEEISQVGYSIIDDFLAPSISSELSNEARQLMSSSMMKPAGVSLQGMVNSNIRGDFTHWIAPESCSAAQQFYLDEMNRLRLALNEAFFLSLAEFECHLAIYPSGAFYQKHLDQFKGSQDRKMSAIIYLNEHWQTHDGGELRLYLDGKNAQPFLDVSPIAGRLVLFDSAKFWHEVLPAHRERTSITGWYRTRSFAL